MKFKRRWSDGSTGVRLSARQLLERLAALTPRPRTNLVLYQGVFVANAKWRARIVPTGVDAVRPRATSPRPNSTWAELMRRGLSIDNLACPKAWGLGRLRLVATIERPDVIRRILEHLGLPAERVKALPARAPPFTTTWTGVPERRSSGLC